jgi:hypothetical protein
MLDPRIDKMDSSLSKLSKREWEFIERRVPQHELRILKLLQKGYTQTVCEPVIISLGRYLKLNLDLHLYYEFFHDRIQRIDPIFTPPPKKTSKVTKADQIRLGNMTKTLPPNLYEFLLLDLCDSKDYFTLEWMSKLKVDFPNEIVMSFIQHRLSSYTPNYSELIYNSVALLEKNAYLKFKDLGLYRHQQELFDHSKQPGSKLILYSAPTGGGKTLSPIGLSEGYDVIIFTCGVRHVCLSFASQCIALNIPIAFAFGCESTDDIRLHNSAAVECIRDKKNGTIKKVNHTIAHKVKIIISDLTSYLHAMNKMLETNDPTHILTYWDEPTYKLDQTYDDTHAIISNLWKQNVIPNVVLSSATLPSIHDLSSMTTQFSCKFPNASIYNIESSESNKTIQMLSPTDQVELPHYHCPTYEDLQQCISHIESKRIILKYMDLGTILAFLKRLNPSMDYFTSLTDVHVTNVKLFYLHCLKSISPESWSILYDQEQSQRVQLPSTKFICSKDAWTLAYGPSLFITDDVKKIAAYCLQTSEIPSELLSTIIKNLAYNNGLSDKIASLEKDIQDKNKDSDKEKKMAEGRVNEDVKRLQKELSILQKQVRPITLPDSYIPNRLDHLRKYSKEHHLDTAYTSEVDPRMIERILVTDVDQSYKLLAMMGVGVLDETLDTKYLDAIKQLAMEKKLSIIIAKKEFIYGTNYQFANLYIGKDMVPILTQEMLIQTAGRVGRWEQVPYTIRCRDIEIVKLLFLPPTKRPEVDNMCRLFV